MTSSNHSSEARAQSCEHGVGEPVDLVEEGIAAPQARSATHEHERPNSIGVDRPRSAAPRTRRSSCRAAPWHRRRGLQEGGDVLGVVRQRISGCRLVSVTMAALVDRQDVDAGGEERHEPAERMLRLGPGVQKDERRSRRVALSRYGSVDAGAEARRTGQRLHRLSLRRCAEARADADRGWPRSRRGPREAIVDSMSDMKPEPRISIANPRSVAPPPSAGSRSSSACTRTPLTSLPMPSRRGGSNAFTVSGASIALAHEVTGDHGGRAHAHRPVGGAPGGVYAALPLGDVVEIGEVAEQVLGRGRDAGGGFDALHRSVSRSLLRPGSVHGPGARQRRRGRGRRFIGHVVRVAQVHRLTLPSFRARARGG